MEICKARVNLARSPARRGMIRKMSHPHSDSRHRLLVIDDDRKLCSLIADYLDPLGYDVTSVHTGPEGAERAVAETLPALILDFMLPGMDGLEVLKRGSPARGASAVFTARGDEADRMSVSKSARRLPARTFSSASGSAASAPGSAGMRSRPSRPSNRNSWQGRCGSATRRASRCSTISHCRSRPLNSTSSHRSCAPRAE